MIIRIPLVYPDHRAYDHTVTIPCSEAGYSCGAAAGGCVIREIIKKCSKKLFRRSLPPGLFSPEYFQTHTVEDFYDDIAKDNTHPDPKPVNREEEPAVISRKFRETEWLPEFANLRGSSYEYQV